MLCIICNKPAIATIRPDMDLTGLGYCLEHKDLVIGGYLKMLEGDAAYLEKMIKGEKKKI